jgi:nucleotide-binding universal stress UspA family protein
MTHGTKWIGCATDFTPGASRAADVAALLAAKWRASVSLVHAAQVTGPRVLVPAHRRLRTEAARLGRTGLTIAPVLLRGFPAGDKILEHLRRTPPMLVTVSAVTKGPFDRWAFGSVSEQVAQGAPVPTLVIHDATPFERWQPAGPALNVLVAVDLLATSDGVLRWVRELRQIGPCDVTVCHVAAAKAASAGGAVGRGETRLLRDLRKKVRDVLGDDDLIRLNVISAGSVAAGILDLAKTLKPHLIVVGTHQRQGLSRLFHGSFSRALLHAAATNLACVPVTARFDPRGAHIPEYRRVLVATDFSELGNAAVPHACGACAVGGRVRIVHVVNPADGSRGERDERVEWLRRLIPAELTARAQPAEVEVIEHADPAAAINAEAERFGADLVCLASHGLGGSRAVFGSVTQRLLKTIRRPVLVVRRPDE